MSRRSLAAAVFASCALVSTATIDAAPKSSAPKYYVKKATWQDTVLASHEALARYQAAAGKKDARERAASLALSNFEPVSIEVKPRQEARRVKVDITGVTKLYIGAGGSGRVCAGNPELTDIEGDSVPLHVGKSRRAGKGWWNHDGLRGWRAMKIGKRTFHRGFQLRDAEIVIQLDGPYETLELYVGSTEPRELRFWVDSRSVFEQEQKTRALREDIRRRIERDFSDPQSQRERAVEESHGIWTDAWRLRNASALAKRYAAACASAQKAAAQKLAAAAKTGDDVRRVRNLFYLQFVEARLDLARRTLALVERSAPRPDLARELKATVQRIARAAGGGAGAVQSLSAEVSKLRRKIILSHPALDFDKLLINQRHCSVPGHMCDQYLGRHSRPGPGLAVIESWKDNPKVTHPLTGKLPSGMTYHPDLSFDAKRVVFAFCKNEGRELRAFFLYEAAIDGSWVKQLTGTDRDPMERAHGRQTVVIEDYDPCYLPDGGIAFTSTRSQQFGRCHGSRYVPSYCLYRCDGDGSNVRRISENEANEWNPAMLHDGRIVYCRWDYVNRHDTVFQSLWMTHPDGTGTAHYYGNYSRSPCMITEARAIPNSTKVVATGTDHHGYTAGTILVIDTDQGVDGGEPLTCVTPELPCPEGGLPRDTFMTPNPLPGDVPQSQDRRGRRRAASPFPLTEDLFLVAYSHGSQYAVYLVDTLGGRELIYYDPSTSCFNPIPVRPTPKPLALPSAIAGRESQKTGRFFVQNVYKSAQPIERGTIERLRINKIIPQPTRSKPILSAVNNEIIKRTLGTVAVNKDGSAAFEAPANMPLQFQLLDANGMAVMTMRSLVYLQPGETAGCVGCHEPQKDTPKSSALFTAMKFQRIQRPPGPKYEGGFSFVRSVQPVLDRYCIGCHGLKKNPRGVDLLGTRTGKFSAAYDSIVKRGLVRIAQRNSETYFSKPRDYFSHASKLAKMILDGHKDKAGKPRVQLDADSFQRIVNWLDLNVQFYGDYSFNRIEDQPPLAEGEKALRAAIDKRFGAELAKQPYAALVNIALPTESRILMAPLSQKAGGWGQITRGAWPSTSDASYQAMLAVVKSSITPRQHVDVAGTCGRDKGCRCGGCFVRVAREAKQKIEAK